MNAVRNKKWNISVIATAFFVALSLHGCAVKEAPVDAASSQAPVPETAALAPADAGTDTPAAVVVVPADSKAPEGVPDAFAVPPTVIPTAVEVKAKASDAPVYVEPQKWVVSPSDGTIRETLAKWAAIAGYTFDLEHWTVPYDLPVTGSDTMYGDFRTVVRRLIATSELTDSPLQPCFYANHLVRVVPINQVCNRFTAR
jgi:hypothetical protein